MNTRTEKQKANDARLKSNPIKKETINIKKLHDSFDGFPLCQAWIRGNQDAFWERV